ncbi:MAG: helix-turn-helix domain-containing protein [Legionella sp.]|jgi:hypothetical protein
MLKPQDIVILLKILSMMVLNKNDHAEYLSQNKLATLLCMSVSEVNAGIKRLVQSGLLAPVLTDDPKNKIIFLPNKSACEECLISGVKYFFPVELGSYTRGIATSYAAPILEKQFILGDDPIPVWPYGEGDKRGLALEPLYSSVPKSLAQYPDQTFYELLVLVDAIRSGRAREKNIATALLKEKIHGKSQASTSYSEFENVGIRSKEIGPSQ